MRNVTLLAVLFFLPGCASHSIPETTVPPFGWVPWEPAPLTLLGSVEQYPVVYNNVSASRAEPPAARLREPFVFAVPKPAPARTRPPASPPVQKRRAATEYVESGTTLKMSASAEGAPPFSYEWRKDGQPIAGANQALLVIENVTPANAGVYECIVSNEAGSQASQPIKVIIRKP